ncbi:hypothetical protein MICAF_2930003 [Microcystis aeruginosa PCC 9807]|uniref:Uncharacterized protein n=1 Tax=Microcystis aeruginosa PCC 9807 TaxID=1160283 RepID=I4H680_MICAE|nr:hypothetical protein MICAF_2930003 [Microcystis aeruginosa PCC 9807]
MIEYVKCVQISFIVVQNVHIKTALTHLQGCTTKANKPITDNFHKVYKN